MSRPDQSERIARELLHKLIAELDVVLVQSDGTVVLRAELPAAFVDELAAFDAGEREADEIDWAAEARIRA
jgi:hypothetical protein